MQISLYMACSSPAGLMWGWGLLLCMFVVIKEQLYGPYPTKDVRLFFVAYGAYLLMPIFVMIRVARYPVFSTNSTPPKKKKVQ